MPSLRHASAARAGRRRRPRRPAPPAADATDTAVRDAVEDADRTRSFSARALGSSVRLFVRWPRTAPEGDHVAAADRAWDLVSAEFAAVDLALSRFRNDSELTALNRAAGSGRVVRVSWRLREAVAAMHRAGRITEGRFDATIAGALERLGEQGASLDDRGPGDGERDHVSIERPRPVVAPARPLDTGGIGKGLALRWAARRALPALPAFAGMLLDAGGDVVAAGEPPSGGWMVGIEDPVAGSDRGADPLAVVALRSGAVATSSIRVRNWTGPDGKRVHHLIDPRTGAPARTGLLAVTVGASDPAWAEVWTKALFLAGRAAIAREARARDLAAWWVAADGHLGMTPAAREQSAWVAEARLG